MARRVVGLDLGAYSVKLVRLECGKQNSRFEIIDVAEEILSEDAEKDVLEKQREAISILSQKGLLEAEVFSIGLGAAEGQMRTMEVPFIENRKIEAILPGLLEAEIPFELDDMVVAWHRSEDEKDRSQKQSETKIRVAFGKKPAIAKTLQMLQGFSVNPRLMNLSSVAPYEIVRELSAKTFISRIPMDERSQAPFYHPMFAFIDFGHTATNLCVFDEKGLCFSRSFLRGGKKLTEEIAKALEISFEQAEVLKHKRANLMGRADDEEGKIINRIALAHHRELAEEFVRAFIAAKTNGLGDVRSIALMGGGSLIEGLHDYSVDVFKDYDVSVVLFKDIFPTKIGPSTALCFGYSLAALHVHAKDSRFNFRKDEFSWRGDLDVFRAKSVPLVLWSLALICSMVILWSANSMVLDKENKHIEGQLKQACTTILGQKNVDPKKCLAMMKEQISTNISIGIPEFSASDIYLKTSELLPPDLHVTFTELDVLEKKVRISAETPSFEEVDKVEASIKLIPCLRSVEKGRAQQVGSSVKFSLSADVDCSPASNKTPKRG